MKKMILSALALMLCLCCAGAGLAEAVDPADWYDDWYDDDGYYYDGVYFYNTFTSPQVSQALMRVASRSGPGTNYDELGSYHETGYILTVLSRAYDDRNGIWWLQVELNYGSELRRVYTGLKRVDIDINDVQDEYPLFYARVKSSNIPYYGPGTIYTAHKNAIAAGTEGIIYGFEDGWVLFEFYNADKKQYRRAWMPIDRVEITGYVTY